MTKFYPNHNTCLPVLTVSCLPRSRYWSWILGPAGVLVMSPERLILEDQTTEARSYTMSQTTFWLTNYRSTKLYFVISKKFRIRLLHPATPSHPPNYEWVDKFQRPKLLGLTCAINPHHSDNSVAHSWCGSNLVWTSFLHIRWVLPISVRYTNGSSKHGRIRT